MFSLAVFGDHVVWWMEPRVSHMQRVSSTNESLWQPRSCCDYLFYFVWLTLVKLSPSLILNVHFYPDSDLVDPSWQGSGGTYGLLRIKHELALSKASTLLNVLSLSRLQVYWPSWCYELVCSVTNFFAWL